MYKSGLRSESVANRALKGALIVGWVNNGLVRAKIYELSIGDIKQIVDRKIDCPMFMVGQLVVKRSGIVILLSA